MVPISGGGGTNIARSLLNKNPAPLSVKNKETVKNRTSDKSEDAAPADVEVSNSTTTGTIGPSSGRMGGTIGPHSGRMGGTIGPNSGRMGGSVGGSSYDGIHRPAT